MNLVMKLGYLTCGKLKNKQKGLDKQALLYYNNNRRKEKEITIMEEIKWVYVTTYHGMGTWYEQYVSEDGLLAKTVWYDGYEEIYEVG